jgi:LmbE family N-acetylglucosaminyl deacetylase
MTHAHGGPATAGGLLLILAHPDDETFFAGGAAARYTDAGVRVALVCATRGQAGSAGTPPLVSRDELPARRERELRDACAELGIALLDVLDYRDRELASAPEDGIRAALVRAVRAERPRVVGTFDPNGHNSHPDHVAISRFALDAVTAAADARWSPELGAAHRVRRVVWTPPVDPWDEWRHDALARTRGVDYLLDVSPCASARRGRSEHTARSTRASTGTGSARRARRRWASRRTATGGGEPPPQLPADDLFAGIDTT